MARALPGALGRPVGPSRATPRSNAKGEFVNQSETQQLTELVITRVRDAPRERVWEAWTDPEQMKKWWGPKDFTAPTVEIDLQEGGKYLNCMRSPDGQDFWSTGVYREIVPMEKLVITDSFADEQGN